MEMSHTYRMLVPINMLTVRGQPFDPKVGGGAGTFGVDRLFIFIMGSVGKFISS